MDNRYSEAEIMYQKVFEHRKNMLGPEHPNTLMSINNLADIIHRQVLRDTEKVLGSENPNILASINNLGLALSSQDRSKDAP